VPLTVSLFTTLLFQSTLHSQNGIVTALSGRDPLLLMNNKFNIGIIRAVARMIYVLAAKQFMVIRLPPQVAVEFQNDSWAIAYLLATMALRYSEVDLAAMQGEREIDGLDWSPELIAVLIGQFTNGTNASRYFSSVVLERIAHSQEALDCIIGSDLDEVANYVLLNRPKAGTDSQPVTRSSVFLTCFLLNVWRRMAAVKHPRHCNFFSSTVTPLAAVLEIKTEPDTSSCARIAQAMFLEMLALMASFDDLLLAVHNEEMMSTVVRLAASQDNVGKEARNALFTLSREAPSQFPSS
jgi:hypothetical protein